MIGLISAWQWTTVMVVPTLAVRIVTRISTTGSGAVTRMTCWTGEIALVALVQTEMDR